MLLRVAERQPDPWLDLLVYTSPSTGPAAPGAWRGGRGERPRSSRSFPPNRRFGQLATGLGRIGRSNRRAMRGPAGGPRGRGGVPSSPRPALLPVGGCGGGRSCWLAIRPGRRRVGGAPFVRPHMLCTVSVDSPRQLVAAVVSRGGALSASWPEASPCSAFPRGLPVAGEGACTRGQS